MYDTESFKELMTYLRAEAHTMEGRKKSRVVMQSARTIIPDKQGRFTIPAEFLKHASIGDTVYLLGNDNKIEIWSEEDYINMFGDEPVTPDMYPQIPY
jgi:DNA-binding transcriptional regulator/RsmH inhibitor MraZ